MKVKIISDSTCDLTKNLLEKYDIDIIPLHVTLGENTYTDGVDLESKDIIEWSNKTGLTPKTSTPDMETFINVFQKYAEQNIDILMITISSEMSGTMQSANIARENFDNIDIRIVDSKNLSTGIGHLVLIAAELSQQGLSAEEIQYRLEKVIPKVRASFFIDSLTFLYRGGRCSALAAFGANSLKIKPQIIVQDGTMKTGLKFRGSTYKVCEKYCNTVLEYLDKMDSKRVFITHSPSDKELIDCAYEMVKSKNYFEEIIVTQAGCVITSHCGENTLGVLYIEK